MTMRSDKAALHEASAQRDDDWRQHLATDEERLAQIREMDEYEILELLDRTESFTVVVEQPSFSVQAARRVYEEDLRVIDGLREEVSRLRGLVVERDAQLRFAAAERDKWAYRAGHAEAGEDIAYRKGYDAGRVDAWRTHE